MAPSAGAAHHEEVALSEDSDEVTEKAATIGAVLAALGPRRTDRLLLMLRALGLSQEEAANVIAHGIAEHLFVSDPSDPSLLRRP